MDGQADGLRGMESGNEDCNVVKKPSHMENLRDILSKYEGSDEWDCG